MLSIARFGVGFIATALISALSHGGCCLFYQTEQLHERLSVFKHTWIGVAAYSLLCCTLVAAAVTLAKKQMSIALGLLVLAIPVVVNDTAGALFDSFAAMPWVPTKGPAFEAFFNVDRIPEKVWYVVLCALALSTAFSAIHIVSNRRTSASNATQASGEDECRR